VGTPFAISAIFALLISMFEQSPKRIYRIPLYLSLGSMGVGFAYLIMIFFSIGS